MTAAERTVWRRIERRVRAMQPEMSEAVLTAFANVRAEMAPAEVAAAIARGGSQALFDEILTRATLATAYKPVQDALRSNVVESVQFYGRVLPFGKSVTSAIRFDFLNPRVIDAVRQLELSVLSNVNTNVVDTMRLAVEAGLRQGLSSPAVAQSLRPLVGIGPRQLDTVLNLRDAMLGVNGRTLSDYTMRDKRFDAAVKNGTLTDAQLSKALASYTNARVGQNANAIAATAARDSQKLAQRLSWVDAMGEGVGDGEMLVHEWITVGDDRVRDEHQHDGEVQPWDQPYSTGQMVPGEGDWGCRCVERFYIIRAA